MSLKKFSKEQWFSLPEEERRFHEYEYKRATESRLRLTILSTRLIALLCVGALIFLGFAMLKSYEANGKIYDQYGPQAHCYLCGLENVKSCECYYQKVLDFGNFPIEYNLTEIREDLASRNVEACLSFEEHQKELEKNIELFQPVKATGNIGVIS